MSAGTGVKYTVDDVNKAISKFVEALPGLGTLQGNLKININKKVQSQDLMVENYKLEVSIVC